MSYGSMHTESVKKLKEFQNIEVLFCMREGGSSSYCEVTQVLFVEMEIPGNSCQNSQAIGVIPAKKDFCFLLELFLHRGRTKSRKTESTNLRLSDVIWLF